MSDFKAKMHQIRLRLGLRPRPRWESLQRSVCLSVCGNATGIVPLNFKFWAKIHITSTNKLQYCTEVILSSDIW